MSLALWQAGSLRRIAERVWCRECDHAVDVADVQSRLDGSMLVRVGHHGATWEFRITQAALALARRGDDLIPPVVGFKPFPPGPEVP